MPKSVIPKDQNKQLATIQKIRSQEQKIASDLHNTLFGVPKDKDVYLQIAKNGGAVLASAFEITSSMGQIKYNRERMILAAATVGNANLMTSEA